MLVEEPEGEDLLRREEWHQGLLHVGSDVCIGCEGGVGVPHWREVRLIRPKEEHPFNISKCDWVWLYSSYHSGPWEYSDELIARPLLLRGDTPVEETDSKEIQCGERRLDRRRARVRLRGGEHIQIRHQGVSWGALVLRDLWKQVLGTD